MNTPVLPANPTHPIDVIKSFVPLTPEAEAKLRGMMVERTYPRRAVITGLRLLQVNVFFIVKGAARVYYLRGSKDNTFTFSFEGQFISLPRFLMEDQPDETLGIEFLEPTTILTLQPEAIREELLSEHKSISNEALLFVDTALIQYSRRLEDRLSMMLHASAIERYEWAMERYPRLLEIATVAQIASFLGLTKETLYRIRSGVY